MSFIRKTKSKIDEGNAVSGTFLDNIATPCAIVSTYIGNPSYTTPDVLDESQDAYLGQLEIADLWSKDSKDIPLSKLIKSHGNCVNILSARNMVTPVAACDTNGIFIDTFGGRHHIKVSDYVSRMVLDQPKAVIAMAHEVNITSGRKPLTKSIERTLHWFQTFMSSPELKSSAPGDKPFIFGTAVAIPEIPSHIEKYCNDLLALGAQGITVGGAHMGEPEELRVSVIRNIRKTVGPDVPILIQGANSIRNILVAITNGVDLVSTNYASTVTAKGYAIFFGQRRVMKTLESDAAAAAAAAIAPSMGDDEEEEVKPKQQAQSGSNKRDAAVAVSDSVATSGPAAKRARTESTTTTKDTDAGALISESTTATTTTAATVAVSEQNRNKPRPPQKQNHKANSGHNNSKNNINQHKPINQSDSIADATIEQCVIDVWDKKYCKDVQPLVPGCQCHACKHHTRAYIHHLLIAKEMLTEVLLYHHNQHQVMELFREARGRISDGTFQTWSEGLLESLK